MSDETPIDLRSKRSIRLEISDEPDCVYLVQNPADADEIYVGPVEMSALFTALDAARRRGWK